MQATAQKADLLRAILIAERAATTRSSLPVLANLKLEVEGGTLTVSATDLELAMVARVPLTKGEDGAVTVAAKQFVEFVKVMPDGTVTLTLTDGKLIVKSGKSCYKAATFSPEEFPVLPPVDSVCGFSVAEAVLREALERIAAASSVDPSRPTLCSVLWRIVGEEGTELGNELTLVATDTHRLHMGACQVAESKGKLDILVPGRTCKELVRLLTGDSVAQVTADKNQLQVSTSEGLLTSRLVDGAFPNYARVIPDLNRHLTVNRRDLLQVINRASIVGKEDSDRILLEFGDGGVLKVTSCTQDKDSDAAEELTFGGDRDDTQAPVMAANWKFLLAAVQACPDEDIRFHHTAANRPTLLHGAGRERFQAVVMPMTMHS